MKYCSSVTHYAWYTACLFIYGENMDKFEDRAFSVAGPTVWNSLHESVRSTETLASYKRKLKTYLFNISF